jgi:hypothetical protein
MLNIDLHAPIVPGKSAAGLPIGLLFEEFVGILEGNRFVQYYEGFDLNAAIRSNGSLLRVDGLPGSSGPTIYFGQDVIRLAFSARGVLGCIYVFDGYIGDYLGAKLGNSLSVISGIEAVEYDGGDEMYYRVDGSGGIIPGLAIVALDAGHASHAEIPIEGFCVHDWAVF